METGDLFRAFVDWLFSDAGAGWVFGTVSLAVLFARRFESSQPLQLFLFVSASWVSWQVSVIRPKTPTAVKLQ